MQKSYKYGIELEVNVPEETASSLSSQIINKQLPIESTSDGSIRADYDHHPREYRTKGGLGSTKLERSMKLFSRLLVANNVKVNASCGFHLHISNKRFFNARNIKRIVHTWVAIEDVLFSTQPRSRYSSSYCKRVLKKYITYSSRYDSIPKMKAELTDYLGSEDRYYALNLSSLRRHGTIEIRLHSGTINSEKILAWVELMTALCEYTIHGYNKADVDKLFRTSISDEKVVKVFKLLGISKATTEHFIGRIDKFAWTTLGAQQQSAYKAMEIQIPLSKLLQRQEKLNREIHTLSQQQQTLLNSF